MLLSWHKRSILSIRLRRRTPCGSTEHLFNKLVAGGICVVDGPSSRHGFVSAQSIRTAVHARIGARTVSQGRITSILSNEALLDQCISWLVGKSLARIDVSAAFTFLGSLLQPDTGYHHRMHCEQALSFANWVRSCHLLRYFPRCNCAVVREPLIEFTLLANSCSFITQQLGDTKLLGSTTIPSQGPTQIQRRGPFDAPQSLPQSLPGLL